MGLKGGPGGLDYKRSPCANVMIDHFSAFFIVTTRSALSARISWVGPTKDFLGRASGDVGHSAHLSSTKPTVRSASKLLFCVCKWLIP